MNLANLTPAPWFNDGGYRVRCYRPEGPCLFEGKHLEGSEADMEFCALARNAFDVMMRRRWAPELAYDGKSWFVNTQDCNQLSHGDPNDESWTFPEVQADPFTALVEAEKWYKENVE